MTENILVPEDTKIPGDTRRAAVLAILLKQEHALEHRVDIIALPSRQMDVHCPLEILKTLRREGRANYFAVQQDMRNRFGRHFSEQEFQKAWTSLETQFEKFELQHPHAASA